VDEELGGGLFDFGLEVLLNFDVQVVDVELHVLIEMILQLFPGSLHIVVDAQEGRDFAFGDMDLVFARKSTKQQCQSLLAVFGQADSSVLVVFFCLSVLKRDLAGDFVHFD